jgi:aspartate/methionine/tyrosine aminotransferase
MEALTNKAVNAYARDMVNAYRKRRDVLLAACEELGLDVCPPQGAFYLFIKVGCDDVRFTNELLHTRRVCVVPGSAYGVGGNAYVRLAYSVHNDMVCTWLNAIAGLIHAPTSV